MIVRGDCVALMAELPEGSVDAIVTDPPYNLSFMSKAWDRIDGEQVDPAFMHWFAGFVDGEGCFSVHKKNVKGYETYDCQFSITLRADDRPILERIQRTLGMGTLSKPTAHRTGSDNPKARYSISRKVDCLRLRDIFRGFPLRAKKANDMELWSDALDAWVEHEPGGGWDDVAEARALLMASRAYVEEGIRVDPFQMWCWRWGREAYRVLKPGGHVLAMGGTRTYHRLTAGLEDAGFEIRDCLAWLYGSGFPKSLDVSKAIDKAAGAEREIVGADPEAARRSVNRFVGTAYNGGRISQDDRAEVPLTDPATPEAERWQGWGTALKPSHEPIVLARKPLAGTVAANVLEHGTGALNVDGCRIEGELTEGRTRHGGEIVGNGTSYDLPDSNGEMPSGRWPANVVLDERAAEMLDQQTGELGRSAGTYGASGGSVYANGAGIPPMVDRKGDAVGFGDSGGASRFLYVAKASSAERSAGLDGKVCVCTSPQRATSGATEEADSCSLTSGSGNRPTDPSLTATRSTTETETRRTTTSGTSSLSRPPITSGSIPPTTGEPRPASGSDAATSAENGSHPTQPTTTSAKRDGLSTVDADLATSQESSPTSSSAVCADCGEVIKGGRRNVHPLEPTVKPIELMRWLVRLVTPPGGTVLDPFTGSGTTGCAAALEGFNFLGFEREAEYVKIAEARIAWWSQHPDGVEIVKALEADRERKRIADSGQLGLLS